MSITNKLGLSNMDDFYSLKPAYKLFIYGYGWLVCIMSLPLFAIEIILYIVSDKSKKVDGKITLKYQKLPYWLGWISAPILILSILFFFFGMYA